MKYLSAIILILLSQAGQSQVLGRPNIVIIVTDDQTYRAIGYENKIVQTPHIDSLARKGIIFRNAFTATPICAASRASLLTGRYPQQHKTIALDTPIFIDTIVKGKKYTTFPQYLKDSGYQTLFAGKSHLGPPSDYGFQLGAESNDNTDSISFQQASDWIDNDSIIQNPFLLWIGARQPHVPLLPDDKWLNKYSTTNITVDANFRESPQHESLFNQGLPGEIYFRDSEFTHNYLGLSAGPPRNESQVRLFIKAYYATISHLDEQVGGLIDQLVKKGLMNNTIIFFISDNGYFLGNHGLGNKITMHEESVHVPFFIYSGDKTLVPFEFDGLVSSLDIFPTILQMAGLQVPSHLPGRSLLPVIKGSNKVLHNEIFSECTGVGGQPGMGHRMVRTRKWKYIVSDTGEEALYNMIADTFERHNVIKQPTNQQMVKIFRRQLAEWKINFGIN